MLKRQFPAKPSTHHPRCSCNLCDRRARAAAEAGRRVAADVRTTVKAEKQADARKVIEADVIATARTVAELNAAERRAAEDARAARFLALRSEGMTSEAAFARVESEFGSDNDGGTNVEG